MSTEEKRAQMLRWLFDDSDDTPSSTFQPVVLSMQFHDRHLMSVLNILSDYVDVQYVGSVLSTESNNNVDSKKPRVENVESKIAIQSSLIVLSDVENVT